MKPFLALTGPTAVGKSSLALELAERIGAEIVSVDSRQVYRDLTIGTAKPDAADLARVPHHFVDERDLDEPFSAGQFAREAEDRIDAILARGHVPLAVGGSTLYLTALVHGLASIPAVSSTVAKDVGIEASTPEGREALFQELQDADPSAAATLDPTKTQRLGRLVGALRETGRPPSQAWSEAPEPRHRFRVVVLDRPRDELYDRINRRAVSMMKAGLIEENRRLLERAESPAVLKAIGYREPQAFLRGEIAEDEVLRLVQRNSRRYAKRQLTWFRRYPSYTWLDARGATPERLANLAGEL